MADELQSGPEPAEVDVESLSPEQVTEQIESLKQGKPARLKKPVEEAPVEDKPKPAPVEKPAEASGGDDDEFKGQETVPHGTFHRANQRRKEAEERAAKAEQERQVAFQRLSELLEAQQRQQVAQVAEDEPEEPDLGPDPESDPVGALKWAREQLAAHDKREREARQQQTEAGKRQAYVNAVVEHSASDFQAAVETRPELAEADDYLMNSIRAELETLGWKGQQLQAKLQQVAFQQADFAYRSKRPIGEYIEQLAKARGWQATPKAIPGQELQPETPRDAQGRFTKEAEKVAARNAAMDASLSLGGGGSPAKTGPLTAQDIINMTPEEYAAFKEKVGEAGLTAAAQRRA